MASLSRGTAVLIGRAMTCMSPLGFRVKAAVMVRVTDVWRFSRTQVFQTRRAFWLPEGNQDWRRRLALTYAVSVWSMIGFVTFMHWSTKDKPRVERPKTEDEDFMDLEEDASQKRKSRVTFSAIVEYKENHVPYTTRIYQYFTSNDKKSDSGSTEN
ncbi:uncharacterized protein ACNLHF_012029 [Anomaloglossus baeobatrachus]